MVINKCKELVGPPLDLTPIIVGTTPIPIEKHLNQN